MRILSRQSSKNPTSKAYHSDSEPPSHSTPLGDTTDRCDCQISDEVALKLLQAESERLCTWDMAESNQEKIEKDSAEGGGLWSYAEESNLDSSPESGHSKQMMLSSTKKHKGIMGNSEHLSLKVDRAVTWECTGETAALEAALRGLFTIKAFTDCFKQGLFKPKQMPSFFSQLNSSYKSLKTQSLQKEELKNMMWLLKARLPHEYIIKLLETCDSISKESENQLQNTTTKARTKLIIQRKGNCEVLHDIFSLLTVKRSEWILGSDKWTYSRLLDIRLESEKYPRIFNLENLLSRLRLKSDWCGMAIRKDFEFFYLGSALIIRLYEEDIGRQQETLICVPRTLNMEHFGMAGTAKYNLRTIVSWKNRPYSDDLIVREIDDSGETSRLLEKGVSAYLLFYEQGKVSKKRNKYGLRNLGNTCFINAAMNGLHSLHLFQSFFITQDSQDPLFCVLKEFCEQYTQEEVPRALLYEFKEAIPEFNDGLQHCANSYIFKLLMLLDTLLPTTSTKTFPQDIFGNKLRQYRKGKCEPLHDIFGTLAENLFICSVCSNTRRNFSYFRTVDVPIPYYAKTFGEMTMFSPNNFYPGQLAKVYTGTEVSEMEYRQEFLQLLERNKELLASTFLPTPLRTYLSHCFKYMLRASLMSPQSLMQCDNCGCETQHYKQTFFRQLSTTFVIHFQRFDERNGKKLNTVIDFPMNLDMSEYCKSDPKHYTLRAVVYHFGSLDSGHYTAWVNTEKRWFNVSDSWASEKRVERPPCENAYMLFYEKDWPANTSSVDSTE